MFSPEELKVYARMGCTAAEATRALRPGGPADCVHLATRCPQCGRSVRESLRWFYLCQFHCSCGGLFDESDLLRYFALLRAGEFALADSIPTITRIDQHQHGDDE